MLEGGFDDSGTHDRSDVVVWGGVMGDTDWFAKLDEPWKRLLDEPIPGKPPIKQFHHSKLSGSLDEFASYRPPERDLAIKAFRDVVIASRLVPVSFSVVLADWDRHITGKYREIWGTAEQFAFISCIVAAMRMSTISKAPVALCFDAARLQDSRGPMIAAARGFYPGSNVEFRFNKVQDDVGLQAADLVAYEAYLLSLQVVRDGTEDCRPHFRRFLEGAPDAHGFIFREREIRPLKDMTDAFIKNDELVLAGQGGFQSVYHTFFSQDGV